MIWWLFLFVLPGSTPFFHSVGPYRTPFYLAVHYTAGVKSLLQTQVDLLMLTTTSTLVAVYLRSSGALYELVSQNPTSVVLPATAEESTLSWLRFNSSNQRESFSLPIESKDHGFWGFLVVSLAKDHHISEKEKQIFDKVIAALVKILSLEGSLQDRVDFDQSNSHLVTIRTFLKMLSKR